MLVVFPESWEMVKEPPPVSEATVRPVVSRLKLPFVPLGRTPAIKLPAAGVQLGENGNEPCCPSVVTITAAGTGSQQLEIRTSATTKWILRQGEEGTFTVFYFFATAAALWTLNLKASFPALLATS